MTLSVVGNQLFSPQHRITVNFTSKGVILDVCRKLIAVEKDSLIDWKPIGKLTLSNLSLPLIREALVTDNWNHILTK